jgi:hypothetical protein
LGPRDGFLYTDSIVEVGSNKFDYISVIFGDHYSKHDWVGGGMFRKVMVSTYGTYMVKHCM